MLTSVYYYNYYKPYILRGRGGRERIYTPVEAKTNTSKSAGGQMPSFMLNKSLKSEVVRYANQLSHNINSLKNIARNLVQDAGEFQANVRYNGLGNAVDWLSDDVEEFVEAYNKTVEFSDKNMHSTSLMNFTETLKGSIYGKGNTLSRYGLSIEDDGKLAFNKSVLVAAGEKRIARANDANVSLFQDIYDTTGEFLIMPMAEHMNFKGLGYYYNYKLGTVQADTFKIIESGLVIDKAV